MFRINKCFIVFLIVYMLSEVSLSAQNTAIALCHSEGISVNKFTRNEEVEELYYGQSDLLINYKSANNKPWLSKRTNFQIFFNKQGSFVYRFGVGYYSNSSTYEIDIDPYWDRRGFYRAQYNDAIKGRVVQKNIFLTIPLGMDYYLRRDKKLNYFVGGSIIALLRGNSIWRSRGFDESGDRVKPRRISSIDESIKKIHYAFGASLGAKFKYSDRIDFLAKLDSDYTIKSYLNDDVLLKQKWLSVNFGMGISYAIGLISSIGNNE